MKKILTYGITLFLVAIFTMGGTYAYFSSMVEKTNSIELGTLQMQVIYSGAEAIEGELELVTKKEDGVRRELSIALAETSLQTKANFYIHAETISEGFATPAFKWEFYEIKDGVEEYINSGTLEGLVANEKKYLTEDLVLTTEVRRFAVYLWVNGHEAGNEVLGAELKGYIGAETTPIIGNTSQ